MATKAEMESVWRAWIPEDGWPCRACVGAALEAVAALPANADGSAAVEAARKRLSCSIRDRLADSDGDITAVALSESWTARLREAVDAAAGDVDAVPPATARWIARRLGARPWRC